MSCPAQNAQPFGAKANDTSLISARKGDDIVLFVKDLIIYPFCERTNLWLSNFRELMHLWLSRRSISGTPGNMFRPKALWIVLLLAGCQSPHQTLQSTSHSAPAETPVPSPIPDPTGPSPRAGQQSMGGQPPLKPTPALRRPDTPPPAPTANVPDIKSVEPTAATPHAEQDVTEADLGAPFYPGSSPDAGSLKTTTPKGTTITSIRLTPDKPLKVLDFYRSKLGASVMANRTVPEPLEVWKVGNAIITVSTSLERGQTQINVTTSPNPASHPSK